MKSILIEGRRPPTLEAAVEAASLVEVVALAAATARLTQVVQVAQASPKVTR